MCQAAYAEDEVKLLDEQGTTRLFHCFCQRCGHAVLAVVLENAGWVSSVGLVTDLEAPDAIRFQTAPSISSDECIQLHQLLETRSGDFCEELLKNKG